MATKLRLIKATGQASARAAATPAAVAITAPAPVIATSTAQTKLRLIRAVGLVNPPGANKLRLIHAAGTATSTSITTKLRLLRAVGKAMPTGPAAQPTVIVATPSSAEPGATITLTATGTPGAAYLWALQPGASGVLTPTTVGGPIARFTPDLNTGDGYLEANIQAVAKLTGYPDAAAIITVRVYPVWCYYVRPDRTFAPVVVYRV